MSPEDVHDPNARNLRMCHLAWRKGLCGCDEVKDLEMGKVVPDVLGGPDIITRVLESGGG